MLCHCRSWRRGSSTGSTLPRWWATTPTRETTSSSSTTRCQCYKTFSSLAARPSTLEPLPLASISDLALLANLPRLSWKVFPRQNVQVNLASSSLIERKSFITLTPGAEQRQTKSDPEDAKGRRAESPGADILNLFCHRYSNRTARIGLHQMLENNSLKLSQVSK